MKKLLIFMFLLELAIGSEWKNLYKDNWIKIGVTKPKEAIKWKKLGLYSYGSESKIVKELISNGISADKCEEITKKIYNKKGWSYRKSSCSEDYKKVINYINSNPKNDDKITKSNNEVWMDGYNIMQKDKWNNLGIMDKVEAIRWRKNLLFVKNSKDLNIIKSYLKAGISAIKCNEIAKVIVEDYSNEYSNIYCKEKNEKIIQIVKKYGLLSNDKLTVIVKRNRIELLEKERIERKLQYWNSSNIIDLNEILEWEKLGFDLSDKEDIRNYSEKLKYLKNYNIMPKVFKEWIILLTPNKINYKDYNNMRNIINFASHNIKINEVKLWLKKDIKIDKIISLKEAGAKLNNINEILENKITIDDLIYLQEKNILIEEAVTWKKMGLTVKSIHKWKEIGILKPIEAFSWKESKLPLTNIRKLKESNYNTINDLEKECTGFITANDFIDKDFKLISDTCFAGVFKLTDISSSNEATGVVVVRKFNKYMQSKFVLGEKSIIIKTSDNLNKDFKKDRIIDGVFKIHTGMFSSNLERLSY